MSDDSVSIRWRTKPEAEEEVEAQLALWFKALGHPLRVRIVRHLLGRDSCTCGDLVELLPVAQSTVSQHLRILKEAGIVIGEVDGPRRCYGLNPETRSRLKRYVTGLL